MFLHRSRSLPRQSGFTLIELLVVIAIIGMLAAVILASLGTARQKARDARRISDISQIKVALELYFDKYQSYPKTTGAADTDPPQALVTEGYIAAVPTDPGTNAAYFYYPYLNGSSYAAGNECTAAGAICLSYHLAANLEDSNSGAFTNDADASVAGGKINGDDSGPCVVGTTGYCYDIVP